MIKAFNSFDLSKGYKFTTYASRIMVNEILMQFRKAEYKKQKVSLDSPVSNDVNNDLNLLDILQDPSIPFESEVEQKELVKQIIQEARTVLTEREFNIISNILSPVPKTQKQLSVDLGVSQSYISRLEKGALKKVRELIKNRGVSKEKGQNGEEMKVMTQLIDSQVRIEGKTLNEKVRYVLKHYPDMPVEEMANAVGTTKQTVRTYISQIKKESKEEGQSIGELKRLLSEAREELERTRGIAKDALERMLSFSEENKKLEKELQDALHEQEVLRKQLNITDPDLDNIERNKVSKESPSNRIERLKQLNNLLMAELLEISS